MLHMLRYPDSIVSILTVYSTIMQYPDGFLTTVHFSAAEKTTHGYLQRPPADGAPGTQQKGEKFVIKEHGQVGYANETVDFE